MYTVLPKLPAYIAMYDFTNHVNMILMRSWKNILMEESMHDLRIAAYITSL